MNCCFHSNKKSLCFILMKTRKSDDTYNAETSVRGLQNLECEELVGSRYLGFVPILMCEVSVNFESMF
jgi:hypothetical protein